MRRLVGAGLTDVIAETACVVCVGRERCFAPLAAPPLRDPLDGHGSPSLGEPGLRCQELRMHGGAPSGSACPLSSFTCHYVRFLRSGLSGPAEKGGKSPRAANSLPCP